MCQHGPAMQIGYAPAPASGGPEEVTRSIPTRLFAFAALALGADAVFVGRPVLWARADSGGDGVAALLAGLHDDLRHAMGLAGAVHLGELTDDLVVPR